jgi:hypothetical protein
MTPMIKNGSMTAKVTEASWVVARINTLSSAEVLVWHSGQALRGGQASKAIVLAAMALSIARMLD